MKTLKIIFLFVMFAGWQNLSACSVPCPPVIANQFKQFAEIALKSSFHTLNNELNRVRKEYENLYENLKASNEKLDIAISLSKNKLLKEKEIVFLLKQFNQLQNIENGIQAQTR